MRVGELTARVKALLRLVYDPDVNKAEWGGVPVQRRGFYGADRG